MNLIRKLMKIFEKGRIAAIFIVVVVGFSALHNKVVFSYLVSV